MTNYTYSKFIMTLLVVPNDRLHSLIQSVPIICKILMMSYSNLFIKILQSSELLSNKIFAFEIILHLNESLESQTIGF